MKIITHECGNLRYVIINNAIKKFSVIITDYYYNYETCVVEYYYITSIIILKIPTVAFVFNRFK